MKLKIFFLIFVSSMLMYSSCSEDEGVTYEVSDVSSRITGFSNVETGPGAQLTINGTELGTAERIFIGNEVIRSRNFVSISDASITFNVPTAVVLGLNDVLVVFGGPERAYATINVVALPAITTFVPTTATAAESVTIIGS